MMAVLSMEVILGSLTFTGSLMAAGKLQEILPQRPITYKGQNIVHLVFMLIAVGGPRRPTGSVCAEKKAQNTLPPRFITNRGQNIVNLFFMLIAVGSAGY